jgi:hypothetical protein
VLIVRFSDEMRELHEAMDTVRRKKEKMQGDLRKKYGRSAFWSGGFIANDGRYTVAHIDQGYAPWLPYPPQSEI